MVKTALLQVADAAAMAVMESPSRAVNSASVWSTDRPSVRAREKLAIMPWFSARSRQASSRLYPPDRAATLRQFG